jgi:MFS family permease
MHPLQWPRVRFVYIAALLMALHTAFTVYINSTFLSSFFPDQKVIGLLYTAGSLTTILGLIIGTSVLRRIKNYYFFITIICIEIFVLLGLVTTTTPLLIKIFFIIHQAIPPLLLFSLDIFLERITLRDKKVGSTHSMYLTAQNIAYVISPLIVGSIVAVSSFRAIYLISAGFCALLLILAIDEFRKIKTRALHEINFIDGIRKLIPHKHLVRLFLINFLLHSFYAGMVIYMPLYLNKVIGFDWQTIGFIFTIMLLPFVLFETPLGRMFDRAHREKETIIAGFIMISVATLIIFFLRTNFVLAWIAVLFLSRIGASFVEVGSEYSFFKRVSDQDAGFISIYRMAGPVAYSIAPIITSTLLRGWPIQYIFLVISLVVLSGIVFVYKLNTLRS